MRYAQGGGLPAAGRRRREQVRLEAVKRFEQRLPAAAIAAELRVSERPVRRWRRAWLAGGPAGVASRGPAARCRLDEGQLAALDAAMDAGPLGAGWADQRWTLARVRDLVAAKSGVQYTVPGIWYLLRRRGWTCQMGAPGHRARRWRGRGVEEGDLAEMAAVARRGDHLDAEEPVRPRTPRRPRPAGLWARIVQRLLALNACIWLNWQTGAPVKRSLIAYDHA